VFLWLFLWLFNRLFLARLVLLPLDAVRAMST
jgi:hypothetical protein